MKESSRAPVISSIEQLASWSLSDNARLFSDLARRQAKLLLLDSIGCALGGSAAPEVVGIVAMAEELGGPAHCTIIGQAKKVDVQNAILANGALLRVLDLNDIMYNPFEGHLVVGGHPSDNIVVALAMAEQCFRSTAEMIDAIIIGYELYGRLRNLMPYPSTFDGTSISGLVAAVMAGRMLGLDEKRQAHALALAAARSLTPGIVRKGHLSAAKSLTNALVAQSGALAALLAERGVTGPLEILDDKKVGLQMLFRADADLPSLWASSDAAPKILGAHVKSYPCIGTGQTAVRAALDARAQIGGEAAIERIDVIMADLPFVKGQQSDLSRRYPRSREAADHSFTFLPAVALVDGELTLRQFQNERWNEPPLKALMEKVTLSVAADLTARAPGSMPCRIGVTLEDGREIVTECLYQPGHSSTAGLDAEVVKTKFRTFARPALTEARCEGVIDFILGIRGSEPVGGLTRLLAAEEKH
jgi:2-methylcitrate dehydratase